MSVAAPGTVARVLEDAAQRHGEKPFLRITRDTAQRTGIEAGDLSYAEAWERTQALIGEFGRIADGAPQRVALLLENRPEMFRHWLALNALGISAAPLNPAWRSAELGYALAHSEARLVIALPERVDELREVVRAEGLDVPVRAPGEDLPQLRSQSGSGRHSADAADRECALLYTSGTTGRPKGCMLSNRYFTMIGDWYTALGGLCALDEAGDCLITPLPMHHMNAMACSTMVMLVNGGCIVPLDRFHPRSWWREVEESGATIVHYLGVMPAILLKLEEDPAERRHGVRFGFGAGVGSRQHVPFEERFGFPLVEAWAMTETGAGAAIIANREPRKRARPASAGRCRRWTCASSMTGPTKWTWINRASCGCAMRATIRGGAFSRVISGTPRPPMPPGRVDGSIPATSWRATPTATCTSSTARAT